MDIVNEILPDLLKAFQKARDEAVKTGAGDDVITAINIIGRAIQEQFGYEWEKMQ